VIDLFIYINEFCRTYYPIISTGFGIASTLFIGYRIVSKYKEKAYAKELRLIDIEKRLHHMDDPETGRVHKISGLCDRQIRSNLLAYGLAKEVKGRMDERDKSGS